MSQEAKTTEEVIETVENKKGVLNAFDDGVSYESFLKSLPKNTDLEEHIKKNYTEEQAEILRRELKHYNK